MKDYKPTIDWLQIYAEPNLSFDYVDIDTNKKISPQFIEQCKQVASNPHLDLNEIDPEGQINLIYEEIKDVFHVPTALSDVGQKQAHYSKTLSVIEVESGEVLANISGRNKNFGCSITIQGGLHPVAMLFLDTDLFKRQSTYVQRLDVAFDFLEEDESFDDVYPLLADIAKSQERDVTTAGDWLFKQKGRTLYLGSRSGFSFVRFYEKGKQLRETASGTYKGPDFNRLEIEFKPKKVSPAKAGFLQEFKQKMYGMFLTEGWNAETVLSYCAMTTAISHKVLDMKISPLQKTKEKHEDQYASVCHMLVQYSKICTTILETHTCDFNKLFSMVADMRLKNASPQTINSEIIKELTKDRIGIDGLTTTEQKFEELRGNLKEYDKGFVDSHIERVINQSPATHVPEYRKPKSFKEMYGQPKYEW